ncbi:MAG: TonB-dependent receptor, partial [Phycisphaerales bacterium]|nr:TonB-dependent receptor [Phycisphaerales bacterium]
TNENGFYTIPLVKPGAYELTVTARGFKQYKQTGIQLETGTPARIDLTLEVGQVSEVVNVEATAPLLQTESSSVGNVIRNESIVNLPLINRRAAQLARLSGFVVQNGTGSNFTMAGGRGDNTNWTIDGGNAQNVLLGVATLNYDLPIDALQEFKVEISNYKAEMGRTGGGVVQFTTRSGTNKFHGTLYEFFRNDALDARSFFSADKPVLRHNQFGGSLGGPVIKDKTHFFFNYEGQRIGRQGVVRQVVPTRAEIQGDFSATNISIIDPLTGQPFPGKKIPANRIDPVGAAIAALYPEPNIAGAGPRTTNFQKNRPIRSIPDNTVTRIDHAFSSNDKIFGRLLTTKNTPEEGPVYPQPGVDDGHFINDNHYYSASGTWFHTFTPVTTMELRYAWDQRKFHAQSGGIGLGLAEKVGLKGTNPNYFPRINLTGLPSLGRGEHERLQFPITGHHLSGSLTELRGNHTLKFGADYRRSKNTDIPNGNAGGTFGFNTTASGDALAALLLGHVNSASRAEVLEVISNAATIGLFGQTDWKVNPKLTLNLGLRWDLDFPRWESNNRQNSFDLTAINPVCNCPGLITWSGRNGLGRYAHNFDKNNFGPRLGFAWNPADKWVVRGGAALVYIGAYDLATPVRFNIGFSSR